MQFFRTLFNDAVPAKLTLTGDFAAPKVKETPEERKARLKALPKATPAGRLAKMEASLAKMKAKLAAAPATTATPTPAPAPTPAPHMRVGKGRK